ncbi:hypothetical protein Lalb_Chr02g0155701 [Lupinus albus]|uniref:Uncharacterized protein n=1 Tax=Lupinus albus TaxID=3870 RepID=A0A6A4R159_LUPAL|nr:hypothetical protein Lalb_Chr02g0155701 [Lupinus albus]
MERRSIIFILFELGRFDEATSCNINSRVLGLLNWNMCCTCVLMGLCRWVMDHVYCMRCCTVMYDV